MNTFKNVQDRIKISEIGCEFIDLTEEEKEANIYHGCGLMLASFINNRLVELFDPLEIKRNSGGEVDVELTYTTATNWIKKYLAQNPTTQIYKVMYSCYQLCEPELFNDKTIDDLISNEEFNRYYESECIAWEVEDDLLGWIYKFYSYTN